MVRSVTRTASWLGFSPGILYSTEQMIPSKPIFKKVAAYPPMEKALVEESVGFLIIRRRPGIISARSGMKKAAIRKKLLKRKKKSLRKAHSDICCLAFNVITPKFADYTILSHNLIKKSSTPQKEKPGPRESRTGLVISCGTFLYELNTGAILRKSCHPQYCPV